MPRLTDLRACRRIISIRWNENESLPKNNLTTFNKLSEQFVCGVSTNLSLIGNKLTDSLGMYRWSFTVLYLSNNPKLFH